MIPLFYKHIPISLLMKTTILLNELLTIFLLSSTGWIP